MASSKTMKWCKYISKRFYMVLAVFCIIYFISRRFKVTAPGDFSSKPVHPSRDPTNVLRANVTAAQRCAPLPLTFPVTAPLFPCTWLSSLPPRCDFRLRASLLCEPQAVHVRYDWVSADSAPAMYQWGDECLERAVRAHCYQQGEHLIPNLSHHVLFGGHPLRKYTFLGIISALRFLQPCFVMMHTDVLPVGPYWDTLVRLVPHLIIVQRKAPNVIFGHQIKVIEHSSDIARLEAVMKFGGVYQDTDYIILNPFEDLRNYSVVMGQAIPNTNYANGIFMGKAGAEFLKVWYDSYRTFKDSIWGFHSTIMPFQIHKKRPDLEFHEVLDFVSPYFGNIKKLFYDNFLDWKNLHGLHFYVRMFAPHFRGQFEKQNSSLGQVSRHILFGDMKACFGGRQLMSEVVRMNLTRSTP